MFFMEPWSVKICLQEICPEVVVPHGENPAVPKRQGIAKVVDLQSMRRGIKRFLDVLSQVMPTISRVDFEIQSPV